MITRVDNNLGFCFSLKCRQNLTHCILLKNPPIHSFNIQYHSSSDKDGVQIIFKENTLRKVKAFLKTDLIDQKADTRTLLKSQ